MRLASCRRPAADLSGEVGAAGHAGDDVLHVVAVELADSHRVAEVAVVLRAGALAGAGQLGSRVQVLAEQLA